MGNCQAIDAATLVIQHPNGKVEKLYGTVNASEIMKINPGHYVALLISTTLSPKPKSNGADHDRCHAPASTGSVRITRIKLLRPTDALVLGQVYRLITTQDVMKGMWAKKQAKGKRPNIASRRSEAASELDNDNNQSSFNRSANTHFIRLDQDILSPLAGKKQLYTYETMDFWEQIKTPGMSLKCSGLYLSKFRLTNPHLLASGDGSTSASISGDVYIHPSAKVHHSAKIGPNVSTSANARIGAGARLISCIILDNVEIKENAIVIHSIVGWKSSIGKWSHVQASGDYSSKLGITILGEDVTVEDEVVIINSIVLPHKMLNLSVQEEIIL